MSEMDKCGHGEGIFMVQWASSNCTIIQATISSEMGQRYPILRYYELGATQ